jgi:hypothetical protein
LFASEVCDALLKIADLTNELVVVAANVIALSAICAISLIGLNNLLPQRADFLAHSSAFVGEGRFFFDECLTLGFHIRSLAIRYFNALLQLADFATEPLILETNIVAFGASRCVPHVGLGRVLLQP